MTDRDDASEPEGEIVRRLLSAGTPSDAEVLAALGDAAAAPMPDGYRVLGEIGRGGVGVVLRAVRIRDGADVALKLLHTGSAVGDEAERRFFREIVALTRLRHPHIVPIHDAGRTDGRVWFAMDRIEGGSLEERLRHGPLRVSEAVRIMRQVAAAIAYVHARGLVHRDVKPANILLDASRDGDAFVTDFGLVRETAGDGSAETAGDGSAETAGDGSATTAGRVLGTPAYMSPEQTRADGTVGAETDVWAMGVVLFECIAGRRPFAGANAVEVSHAVLHGPIPLLRDAAPSAPRAIEAIVACALERNPRLRYRSAQAFLEDLDRFAVGAAPSARPPTVARRIGRSLATHRRRAAVVGLVAVAAIAAAFAWSHAPRDADDVETLADRLLAEGEPGGARLLYRSAADAGPERRELRAKLAAAAAADAARRIELGDLRGAAAVAAEALRDGHARADADAHPTDWWPGRARLEWELASAKAGLASSHETSAALRAALHSIRAEADVAPWRRASNPWAGREARVRDTLDAALRNLRSDDPAGRAAGVAQFAAFDSDVWQDDAALDAPLAEPGILLAVLRAAGSDIDPGAVLLHRVLRAVRRSWESDPDPIEALLADTADDATASDPLRRTAAHVLGDLADLPVGSMVGWGTDPRWLQRRAFDPADVTSLWRSVRTLDVAESLRARVGVAVGEARRLAESPWKGGVIDPATLPRSDFRALRAWTERHAGRTFPGGSPAEFSAALDAWWSAHGDEDPVGWFAPEAGVHGRPDRDAIVAALRSGLTDEIGAFARHRIACLTATAGDRVPRLPGDADLGSLLAAWRASASADPLELRCVTIDLAEGRLVVRPLDPYPLRAAPGAVATASRTDPLADSDAFAFGIRLPGTVPARPVGPGVLRATVELRPPSGRDSDGTSMITTERRTSSGGEGMSSGGRLGSSARLRSAIDGPRADRIVVAAMSAGPDPPAAELSAWTAWIAAAMEREEPSRGGRDVAEAASFVPVPAAIPALVRAQAATRRWRGDGNEDSWFDPYTRARVLGGDLSAVPDASRTAFDDVFLVRAFLVGATPEVRAWASGRLAGIDVSGEQVGVLADAIRAGAVAEPGWFARHRDRDDALPRGSARLWMRKAPAQVVLSGLLVVCCVVSLLRVAVRAVRGSQEVAAAVELVLLGVGFEMFDAGTGATDWFPSWAGRTCTAVGMMWIARCVRGRAAGIAAAAFCASLVAEASSLPDPASGAGAWAFAVGIACFPAIAWRMRMSGDSRRPPRLVASILWTLAAFVGIGALTTAAPAIGLSALALLVPIAALHAATVRAGRRARAIPVGFAIGWAIPALAFPCAAVAGALGASGHVVLPEALSGILLTAAFVALGWAAVGLRHAAATFDAAADSPPRKRDAGLRVP